MLNSVALMGRLVRDPELRYTQSQTPVCSFTLAVDADYTSNGERGVEFLDCVAWKGTAELVSKWFAKGKLAVVTGRLHAREWQDKDGNKRRNTEVICDKVYFAEKKPESKADRSSSGFEDMQEDDGDLPF